MNNSIAVLIPCYNEALTIATVVQDFKKALPGAVVYVYDNDSNDDTARIAKEAGAVVKKEPKRGKGNVVRSMFRDIDADVYIMVDGDDTYPASAAPALIEPIIQAEADMVVGNRHANGSYKEKNSRALHNFGNNLVVYLINKLYRCELGDIMSGYRALSRDFVKHFPVNSEGFEIETEMSMHALDKRFSIVEVPIEYKERPEGSVSKLNTFVDGFKVLKTIFWLFKDYKPLAFFSWVALLFFLLSLVAGVPVIVEFLQTHYVSRVPSAVLAVGLMLIAIMALFVGFILDTVVKQHRENFELMRLQKKR